MAVLRSSSQRAGAATRQKPADHTPPTSTSEPRKRAKSNLARSATKANRATKRSRGDHKSVQEQEGVEAIDDIGDNIVVAPHGQHVDFGTANHGKVEDDMGENIVVAVRNQGMDHSNTTHEEDEGVTTECQHCDETLPPATSADMAPFKPCKDLEPASSTDTAPSQPCEDLEPCSSGVQEFPAGEQSQDMEPTTTAHDKDEGVTKECQNCDQTLPHATSAGAIPFLPCNHLELCRSCMLGYLAREQLQERTCWRCAQPTTQAYITLD